MRNLSRGSWLALAAVVAVPTTIAIAATAEKGGWRGISSEGRARLDEGHLAMAKAALKLTPDQEKLWAPIEAQVRDAFKARDEHRAEWKKEREERKAQKSDDASKRPNMAERFEKMSKRLSERADRFKAFSSSFSPFYATLNDEQKEVLRPVMRELMPGVGGGHRGGPRWAMGGWGPEGGPGHHGRHGGWSDGPGDHGRGGPADGPGAQDDGPGDDGAAPPPAEPDKKD